MLLSVCKITFPIETQRSLHVHHFLVYVLNSVQYVAHYLFSNCFFTCVLLSCCEYPTYGIDDVDIYDNTDIVLDCCSGLERGNSKDCTVQMTALFTIKLFSCI